MPDIRGMETQTDGCKGIKGKGEKIMIYGIWEWLMEHLGFSGATLFVYAGFAITAMITVWYITRLITRYYEEAR